MNTLRLPTKPYRVDVTGMRPRTFATLEAAEKFIRLALYSNKYGTDITRAVMVYSRALASEGWTPMRSYRWNDNRDRSPKLRAARQESADG